MLHPTLQNADTPWSRHKSKVKSTSNNLDFPLLPLRFPDKIPESSPLKIITLNLARFPFSPEAPHILYNFIRINQTQIFLFQEVKDTKLLQSVFNRINDQLYSQEYILKFSSHTLHRTKLCFAYRNNSIKFISHKSLFVNLFLNIPHIIRPPDHLSFKYREHTFSLLNLHGTPYRSHPSHLKRDKFFYLLKYINQTFNDGRFKIFGGDWNFRPPGLNKFFTAKGYVFPENSFKNLIDYFVTSIPVETLYPLYEITQTSFASFINKSKTFRYWKEIISDHYPVQYSFEFI